MRAGDSADIAATPPSFYQSLKRPALSPLTENEKQVKMRLDIEAADMGYLLVPQAMCLAVCVCPVARTLACVLCVPVLSVPGAPPYPYPQ